jgi:antitoxin MazE
MIMRTRLIQIGNSQGVRIPKPLIEDAGLGEEVDLSIENHAIVIRPVIRSREGWDESFREMACRGDDSLLDPETASTSTWDEDQWQWP